MMRAQALCLRVGLGLATLSLQGCTAISIGQAAVDRPPTPIGIAPFELHNAHVYVRVQVADSVSGWFILDTGGSTTLDSAVAMSLGRPIVRTETGSGGGEASFAVRFIDGVQLRLVDGASHPVAVVPAQRVASVDLSAVARGEGRPVAGILGGSFFARYAVVIDYDRGRVEVHRRGDYRGATGWVAVPLRVQGDLVFARGMLTLRPGEAPVAGWYNVDSGGGHVLILNTPFVSRQGLATPGTASADAMLSLGGGARAQQGRVASFGIGGVTRTDLAALFSQAPSGFFSSDEFDGSVGGGLLTHYSGVAFDYASKRMWLGPLRLGP
jgi:hypothetical protein